MVTAQPDIERSAPVVELRGITKRFPGVVANDGVSLGIRAGEVHVLLGENGAGKSTLIGILSGLMPPDEGEIVVRGRPVRIDSPRTALGLGIGTVFQHVMLVPTLTVAENLMLGGPWWGRPDAASVAARFREMSAAFGIAIDPAAVVGTLSLGEQQQVEIIRALWRGEGVLILDEPTSMLTPQGIAQLGVLMRRLRDRGVAIVFITHKLNEAFAFGDRVSVLRLGRLVGAIAPEELARMTEREATARIVELMFGRAGAAPAETPDRRRARPAASAALKLQGVTVLADHGRPLVEDVAFEVGAGEIFGIAGVDGNGQKPLAEAIAGQRATDRGAILLDGEAIDGLDVSERYRRGVRYVTDDRLGEGTVAPFALATNLVLKEIGAAPFWKRGLVRTERIDRHAERLIAEYDVRTPGPRTPIGRLSGGNIQKALLARELHGQARLVVYNKPTYGLDVQNIRAARERILAGAAAGVVTILISTDLDELLALSDRIGVMLGGRMTGIVAADADAHTRVGELMIGAVPA